jgi:hypothetical protein
MLKRLIGILGWGLFTVSIAVGQSSNSSNANTAQSGSNNQEMSVEESYLQQSVENMIIHEQSRSEGREMKLVALAYIGDAINNGNTGEEVHSSLEYLSLEGVINQSRENGRLINNYPDIRREAARYLGDLGTPEAKKTLLKIIYADNEPMVLQEAIRSLGRIGNNDNGEVTSTIAWALRRFDVLNPDNLLALAALDAFEVLLNTDVGLDASAIQTIQHIATNSSYIKPVQRRAMDLLSSMRKSSSDGGNTTASQSQQR